MTKGNHTAAASAAGFQHQTWWALLELLKRGGTRPGGAISLEVLDDVAWTAGGQSTELLQLKHHVRTQANLSDGSVDLWKTLASWMDSPEALFVDGAALYLITTGSAPPGSAASYLTASARNVATAHDLLVVAAADRGGKTTAASRARFSQMLGSDRLVMLSKVHVLDKSLTLGDLREAIQTQLLFASPTGHEEIFLSLVLGWWDQVAVDMLLGRRTEVTVSEARRAISDLRDGFLPDNLPTLVALQDVDEAALLCSYSTRVFVKQLESVGFPPVNLRKALIDYYRAYRQTELWLDEDLIGSQELQRFQDDLVDEWEREFEFMQYGLPVGASDDDLAKAGLDLLRRLLNSTEIRVRPRYDDAFFARGKRHELADEGRVWWNPAFEATLKSMLVLQAGS